MGNICVKSHDINNDTKQKLLNYSRIGTNQMGQFLTKSQNIKSIINDQWQIEIQINKGSKNYLVDLMKFGSMYQNYDHEQGYYKIIWEGIEVQKPSQENVFQKYHRVQNNTLIFHWKYIIRRGVPVSKTRNLLLNMIPTNWNDEKEEYIIIKKQIFQGRSDNNMKTVPTFQKEISINNILTDQCLTPEGIDAMNRILWIIKENYPNLEYNPLIVQTIQYLMIFLDEIETYIVKNLYLQQLQVIKHLLQDSIDFLHDQKQKNSEVLVRELRWHFSITQKEFLKASKVFFDLVQARIPKFKEINDKFKQLDFNFSQLFQNWVANIFQSYLRFNTILRIMTLFINEGIRVFIKISYGICMILQKDIIQCQTSHEMEQLFKKMQIDLTLEQTDQLFQMAYTLKIKKAPALYKYTLSQEIPIQISEKDRLLYRPKLNQQSKIISYQQIEEIWEELPKQNKLSNPKLVFSSAEDGYRLQTLYSKLNQYQKENPILILIKTDSSICGAFSPLNIDLNQKQYYSTDKCFVFILEPQIKFYKPNQQNFQKNQDFLYANYNFFCFGSENPALQINEDLSGYTQRSSTYQNNLLNNKKSENTFQCLMLEVFILDF